MGQYLPDACALSARGGDDVYGSVPPRGDLCAGGALEDGRPVPLAAAHQQLENFTSGDFIELIGNDWFPPADGVICR